MLNYVTVSRGVYAVHIAIEKCLCKVGVAYIRAYLYQSTVFVAVVIVWWIASV